MKTLANYIFDKHAKYLYFLVVSISLASWIFAYKWYIDYELKPINATILSMEEFADKVSIEIHTSESTINFITEDYSESQVIDSKMLHEVFYQIGANAEYFFGVGYFWNPIIKNYGEYMYADSNNQINIESMNQIYQSHGATYYNRPWFIYVMENVTDKMFSPQSSWSGDLHQNMLTYVFPILHGKMVVGVGVFDISMAYFESYLNKFRSLKSSRYNSLSVYYISSPYGTSHDDNLYYEISNHEQSLQNTDKVNELNKIYNDKLQNEDWSYHGGNIYRKVSLLKGGLVLIVEYNLQTIFWLTFFWIIFTIVGVQLIMRWLRKIIISQLAIVVNPISEISKQVTLFSQHNVKYNFSSDEKQQVQEIDLLVTSLDKMQSNLLALTIKELELEKSKAELELAARLQNKMIPSLFEKTIAHDRDLSIAARFIPANVLSGDLYDIVISDTDIYILIGDATGKNITAAFFSLFILGRFRLLCKNLMTPSEILDDLNQYLCNIDAENMFISAVCMRINLATRQATFSNAGHEMPLLILSDNSLFVIQDFVSDIVLGIIAETSYQLYLLPEEVMLIKIVLCTDGITEARSPDGNLFGIESVQNVLLDMVNRNKTSLELCDYILDCCYKFEQSDKMSDDRTIVVVAI